MADATLSPRFLGVSAARWRLLVVAFVVATFWLVFFASTAHANDCIEYVKNPGNLVGIPKALIEDCMRTGYVQAGITAVIAVVTGGTIAVAATTAIKTAFPPGTEAPADPESPAGVPPVTPPPEDEARTAVCPHCHKTYYLARRRRRGRLVSVVSG